MPIDPQETSKQKAARLRKEAAARSKKRRDKTVEANDPWCQNISGKKPQDEHPES